MIFTFYPWPTLMVMSTVGSQTECGEKTDDLSAHLRRDLHQDNLEDLDKVERWIRDFNAGKVDQ